MIVLQRRVYWAALLLWVLSIVLFPTWIGGGGYKISPLWNPTRAFPAATPAHAFDTPEPPPQRPIPTRVRWPLQSVAEGPLAENVSVIEISWLLNAVRLSVGVLVLGVVTRVWNWWTGPKVLDPVITMAWSLSLWQVIAWPCLVFSGAWMVSDLLAAGILGAGLLAGLFYGVWSLRVRAVSTSSPPATNAPVICEPARVSQEVSGRSSSPISALAWFALGFIGALCLIFVILWAASFFRGPILGYNELGGVRYARDQFFVQLAAGLAVLTTGWGTALGLRRLKAPRPLTWGIIVIATPLGIAFACGM